jgi:hypothetical protein
VIGRASPGLGRTRTDSHRKGCDARSAVLLRIAVGKAFANVLQKGWAAQSLELVASSMRDRSSGSNALRAVALHVCPAAAADTVAAPAAARAVQPPRETGAGLLRS